MTHTLQFDRSIAEDFGSVGSVASKKLVWISIRSASLRRSTRRERTTVEYRFNRIDVHGARVKEV